VQEEVTAGDLVTLLRLRGAGVAVTETTLPPGATVAGTPAGALRVPAGVALTAIIRGEGVLLPDRAGPRGPATWSWRSASPASSMRCTTC